MTPLGCMGSRGHPDDPDDPRQRDHAQPARVAVETLVQRVVLARAARARGRQGLVHVPGEHRPHGPQGRLPRGGG